MKSFSPAGMAVKAFYGLGARTFGNPSGAKSGNGGVYPQPPAGIVVNNNWAAGWTLNNVAGNHYPAAFGARNLPHAFLVVIAEQQAGALAPFTYGGQPDSGSYGAVSGGFGYSIFDLNNFPPANDLLDFGVPSNTVIFNAIVLYNAPNNALGAVASQPSPYDWIIGGAVGSLFVIASQAEPLGTVSTTSNDPAQVNQTTSGNPFGNGEINAIWQIVSSADPVDFTVTETTGTVQNTANLQFTPT